MGPTSDLAIIGNSKAISSVGCGTALGERFAAASARPLTTRVISGLLLTPASGPFGSGSARLGLSQKDGLPNRWLAFICCGSRPSTRARGAAYGLLLCMRTNRARSEANCLIMKSCGQFAERLGKGVVSRPRSTSAQRPADSTLAVPSYPPEPASSRQEKPRRSGAKWHLQGLPKCE